jgi:hypothetical protein
MKKFEKLWCDAGTNIMEQHSAPISSIPNGGRMFLHNSSTGVPLYQRIQYAWFQLSVVHRSPQENWKIKEINGL